mmetsp:Transcript_14954/g.35609  ORF Transcript_14954/g.35609 Transcript_14954/m.35609 type:complete len:155 (+) Transcript_14954:240-704(+)
MYFMSEEWFICGVMLKNTWARTMKHFNGAKGRLNCLHPSATPSQHGDLVMPHPRAGAPCHWHAQISQQSKPIACAGSAGRLTVLQTGVEQQALIRFSDASARKASAKGQHQRSAAYSSDMYRSSDCDTNVRSHTCPRELGRADCTFAVERLEGK